MEHLDSVRVFKKGNPIPVEYLDAVSYSRADDKLMVHYDGGLKMGYWAPGTWERCEVTYSAEVPV